MTDLEFNSICRLCVQIFGKEKMSPIFSNENYKISLSERIKCCSTIEVDENDGLPSYVCNTCLLKLNESFVFRNQCVLADITLKWLRDLNFDVSEIPNLSKVDIENQVIQSGNDDFLHAVCSAETVKSKRIKSEENFDEFDNSKNGGYRQNIHKLKSISLQKRKSLNKKPQEDASQKLDLSGNINNNIFTPTVILSVNERKKMSKKQFKKKIIGNNDESGTNRKKKFKRLKQFLKIEDLKEDVETVGFELNKSNKYENIGNASGDLNDQDLPENCNKEVVETKNAMTKKGRKKKLPFIKEKPSSFKCDYCQKVYPSEGGWRYHIHTVHNENYQPFICDLCGQSFKVKKNLEAHKNSIHFHLKHHLCDLCGRGFASRYSLKVHKSWHNDEKNFTCDVCGTKFRTRGKMNTHRSIHGGPKKFMCHICSRDFRWKKDFEIHMRTHTGEKPFKCSHCGKAFASLTNMKKHEKNHTKKLEIDKISEKLDEFVSPNDGKSHRNEILDFGFGSEDIRNRQTNQVPGTTLYLICKE